LGSFKVKLVVYFLLLSIVPIGAAYWGFTSVAGQSETRSVDARLQAGLRGALAAYQERLDEAQASASALARNRTFQTELQTRNSGELRQMLRDANDLYVDAAGDDFHIGRIPPLAAQQRVEVFTRVGLIGTVVGYVPSDTTLASILHSRSGLISADTLVILDGSRILAASQPLAGTVAIVPGETKTITVARIRYRTLAAPTTAGSAIHFAVLSPQSRIDAADDSSRNRLLLGLIASLALISIVAYLEGRSIVRTVRGLRDAAHAIARGRLAERVPVRGRDEFAQLGDAFNDMAGQLESRLAELGAERGRLRDAVTRFGEALAATHDVEQLQRVVVETAVQATAAAGARLYAAGGTVYESGNPDALGEQLELSLTAGDETFGTLVLVGVGFDDEQRRAAVSLASQAAVALENARLHRIVERQALVDDLTGVANRRQTEDALPAEIARAERLGTSLTLVVADLDDFKSINDEHGHAVGDDVLREFAAVLRATVRESDLAGRWGGEEFLLLLPGTDAVGGAQLADRVRVVLAERSFAGRGGAVFQVTCSFGVAQLRAGDDGRELFAAADRALYRAKRKGKNRVEVDAPIGSF
jgi:diguanylate cyclase (GGDEF)-like protein